MTNQNIKTEAAVAGIKPERAAQYLGMSLDVLEIYTEFCKENGFTPTVEGLKVMLTKMKSDLEKK